MLKSAEGNFGLFSGLERSTKILYDVRKFEHFAVLFVYTDKEQLDKPEFVKETFLMTMNKGVSVRINRINLNREKSEK